MSSEDGLRTMNELAHVLSVEHRLMERLLLKLLEGRCLLDLGEVGVLHDTALGLERAVDRLQEAALRRSMLVYELALALEVSESALSLGGLARVAGEPFGRIFAEHRIALLDIAEEIQAATRAVLQSQSAEIGDGALLGATRRLSATGVVDADFLR